MPAAERTGLIFIGTGSADSDLLAQSLPADRTLTCPALPRAESWQWDWADDLTAWRRELEALPLADRVVVCTWPDPAIATALVDLGADRWRQEVEWPTALWFSTLVAAADRCDDDGTVVVVADRPAALDAIGRGPAVAVADGLSNLVRSLAAHAGDRGVRVNAVVTSLHTDAQALAGAAPPLTTFPGRVDVEATGAVRLLLSDDSLGITGTTLSATCGRR